MMRILKSDLKSLSLKLTQLSIEQTYTSVMIKLQVIPRPQGQSTRFSSSSHTLQFDTLIQLIIMSSIRDFVPLSKLGEGAYSTVYKVRRNTDQQIYALKKVKMNQLSTKQKENALNQIRILASIDSPSIISYKDAFFDETINVLCIVMEYADEGDLLNLINETKKRKGVIEQKEIWSATKNILIALQNLHSRGIMHRDLKSANVFKSKVGYKLGDLNVSKVVSGQLAYTQTGTPYYASPQVWRDEPYDAKSDIWSLGCIIFEMAGLRPPFEGRSMEQLFKSIQNRPVPSIPGCYSNELFELIQICLKKRPSQRLTAQELLNYPNFHQYFRPNAAQRYDNEVALKKSEKAMMKQKLLNTIKLPSDMSKLKQKLPNSKYEGQSKSFVALNFMEDSYKSPKNQNVNKSQLFRSPPTKISVSQQKLLKSPVANIKLADSPAYNIIAKYSDRLQLSDKRSNKVERPIQRNYLNIEKYLKQQLTKRPLSQNSLPKTEKSMARREVYSSIAPISSQPYLRNDFDEIRQKLVKKSRVFSNKPKPSWWG